MVVTIVISCYIYHKPQRSRKQQTLNDRWISWLRSHFFSNDMISIIHMHIQSHTCKYCSQYIYIYTWIQNCRYMIIVILEQIDRLNVKKILTNIFCPKCDIPTTSGCLYMYIIHTNLYIQILHIRLHPIPSGCLACRASVMKFVIPWPRPTFFPTLEGNSMAIEWVTHGKVPIRRFSMLLVLNYQLPSGHD